MLSLTTAGSIASLLDILQEEVVEEFQMAAVEASSRAVRAGAFHSSGHLLEVDGLSAEAIKRAADKVLELLLHAHEAEPTKEVAARAAQLGALLDDALTRMGAALQRERDERVKSVQGFAGILNGLPKAIRQARAKSAAQLQMRLAATHNRGQTVNTFNVNGPVGSIQTGDNSTANVVQTLVPDRDAALQALTRIEETLRQGQDRGNADVLDVLGDLRQQIQRDSPNRLKVSVLLGGLATVIQTIPQLAPAWDVLTRWGSAVRDVGSAAVGL